MQEFTLTLLPGEIEGIMQMLGQLPTSSGAYPLLLKVKEQVEAQMPKSEEQAL